MSLFRIQAGQTAYQHIKRQGLSPSDISAVFGASGAAKWLAISGLDAAIFGRWLVDLKNPPKNPIVTFGTSIGALKLAAAARHDPERALNTLAKAYSEQWYGDDVSISAINREVARVFDEVLDNGGTEEILTNPNIHAHFGAIQALKSFASEASGPQKRAFLHIGALSLLGRQAQLKYMQRAVFGRRESLDRFQANDAVPTTNIPLSKDNLRLAIQASGALPVMMQGVTQIPGADANSLFRDGGMLDYHPLPDNLLTIERDSSELVLYPHFYDSLKEAWFDKFYPWRRPKPGRLDKVILISPSRQFIDSLPEGRIPDRKDFIRFKGQDQTRIDRWSVAIERSQEMGEQWLNAAKSGKIADQLELIR